jgi:DNA-binding CsgD family transcriptional regulator
VPIDPASRLLLDLYRAARELPIAEFEEHSLGLFKSVCRFDSALWGVGRVEADAGLSVDAVHLHNLPVDFLTEYEEVKENDRVAFEAARRMGEVCSFNLHEVMSGAGYADVARFDKRWELENLLVATVLDEPVGAVGFLSLYRAKGRDRYTEDDRRSGEALLPHLLEAGTINRLFWLNSMSDLRAARRGARAIANERGQLETRDPEFSETLRKEWPHWAPPMLPGPLIAELGSSRERRFIGKRITIVASLQNGMLFLRAKEKERLEQLTSAEIAAATLVANGYSYKEAAKRLLLSPATVRNQLHSVYAKLGINNKATLARRLSEYAS